MYSKFDLVFDNLHLEIEYEGDEFIYGRWLNKKNDDVFSRNSWGVLWIDKCEPYKVLRAYSKSIGLDLDEFNNMLKTYINERYGHQFNGKLTKNVDSESFCLDDEYLGESVETYEIEEGELTERCWAGYTQKGMKTMFGKRYPNCVKKTNK